MKPMRNLSATVARQHRTVLTAALSVSAVLFAGSARAQQAQSSTTSSQTAAGTTPKPVAKPAATSSASSATKTQTAAKKPVAGAPLTTDKSKQSYALGANIGSQLSSQHLTATALDNTSFLRGLKDALQGGPLALTDDQIKAALAELQNQAGETTLKQGEEFLAKNKTKEGVVTTPSGLQYKVITMGTGPKPALTDTVVCDYAGTLIDGKEFDSSYKRGQPAAFPVNRVIKGWTEALQMMSVGSKWQLFIPSSLAYGASGAGSDIGPNETLIFQVELHSIQGK
jgi:FKBP-type peptidyl-prolyl cis-trans isomerase FklB